MISLALISALIAVESGGNDHARGQRGEVGCLQISTAVVADCNRVQDLIHFTPEDRDSRIKSIQMLEIYLWHYAPNGTPRELALTWHRGPSGKWDTDPEAQDYWQRVKNIAEVKP